MAARHCSSRIAFTELKFKNECRVLLLPQQTGQILQTASLIVDNSDYWMIPLVETKYTNNNNKIGIVSTSRRDFTRSSDIPNPHSGYICEWIQKHWIFQILFSCHGFLWEIPETGRIVSFLTEQICQAWCIVISGGIHWSLLFDFNSGRFYWTKLTGSQHIKGRKGVKIWLTCREHAAIGTKPSCHFNICSLYFCALMKKKHAVLLSNCVGKILFQAKHGDRLWLCVRDEWDIYGIGLLKKKYIFRGSFFLHIPVSA